MILVYPPVAKPSEAPAGLARLAGALNLHGVEHHIIDANLEGMLHILKRAPVMPERPYDTWTSRAIRNRSRNLTSLKNPALYLNADRYKRAVLDLNRVIEVSAKKDELSLSIVNFRHAHLSPLMSSDLIKAAEEPESNPFYLYFSERLQSLIELTRPAVVGFSLNYLSQALCTFAMAGFLRRDFPGLKVVLGGGLVTSWMNRPQWKNPFGGLVDLLVAGPGEHHLLSIAGVQHESGKVHFTPHYDLCGDGYIAPGFILPYSASMGCYWNRCSFCPERAEDNPYIPIPVDRVLGDLACLIESRRPLLIHFLDNALSPSILKGLALNPHGIPWYGFARIGKDLTDIDFCRALKRSGCVMLKLGLESGDQDVLDRLEKGIDLTTASRALSTLRKAGIATYVYLLFGTPSETLASARKTLGFIVRHGQEIGFLNLAMFNMPAHGPEADGTRTRSFYEGDLFLYTDFVHPHGWNRKKVRHFLANEFRTEKSVASILQRDPPFFTSNHAPFFAMRQE